MDKKCTNSAALTEFTGQSEHQRRVVKLCTGEEPRAPIKIADFPIYIYMLSTFCQSLSCQTSLTSLAAHSLNQITPASSQLYAKPTHPLSAYFDLEQITIIKQLGIQFRFNLVFQKGM